MLQGKEYGKDLKDAKIELRSKLEEFKDQAQICAHKSFARMESKLGIIAIGEHLCTEHSKNWHLTSLNAYSEVKELSDTRDQAIAQHLVRMEERLTAALQNQLYLFLGSNDIFDPLSGARESLFAKKSSA